MDAINDNSALQRVLSEFSLQGREDEEKRSNSELGRDEFLRLLIAQLENQDATSPRENDEFISQLAQFSALQESQKLSASFESFTDTFQSSQHLQATSLVGRPVHVQTETTLLDENNPVSVVADMPAAAGNANLNVFNQAGELVDSHSLGAVPAGRNEFIWSGQNSDGERFPPGMYRFEVTASRAGETESVPLFLSANVNSVTIEPGGSLTLNLAGVGPTPVSEVVQIN